MVRRQSDFSQSFTVKSALCSLEKEKKKQHNLRSIYFFELFEAREVAS